MNCIKRHIASLLLLGFLFPQLANAVHYYIVSHEISSEEQNKVFFSGPAYEYHSCDYHLSGFKFLFPTFEYSGKYIIPECGQEIVSYAFLLFTEKAAFHYSVRGPPHNTRTLKFIET